MQQAKFIFPDFRRAGGLGQFFQRREMPLELIIREKRIFKISPRIRTGVATNANPSITIWQSALFENGRQQPRGRERRFSAARRADQRQEMRLTLSSENRSKTIQKFLHQSAATEEHAGILLTKRFQADVRAFTDRRWRRRVVATQNAPLKIRQNIRLIFRLAELNTAQALQKGWNVFRGCCSAARENHGNNHERFTAASASLDRSDGGDLKLFLLPRANAIQTKEGHAYVTLLAKLRLDPFRKCMPAVQIRSVENVIDLICAGASVLKKCFDSGHNGNIRAVVREEDPLGSAGTVRFHVNLSCAAQSLLRNSKG